MDLFEGNRRGGKKDGLSGALRGTRGDPTNQEYQKEFEKGRFVYEKNKYGETAARVLKDDRDRGRRISENKEKPKEEEYTYRKEEPLDSCPRCGEDYDGYYCDICGYDPIYDDEDDDYCSSQEEVASEEDEEEDKKDEEEEKIKTFDRGTLYISKYTSPERLQRMKESGEIWLYSKVTFVPPHYLLRYKCDCCDHEWDDIWKSFGSPKEIQECRMGCSAGVRSDGRLSVLGLYRIIKGLIIGKEPFGYGRLISSKEL